MLDLIWRLKEKDAMPSNVLQNLENAFQACRPQLSVKRENHLHPL